MGFFDRLLGRTELHAAPSDGPTMVQLVSAWQANRALPAAGDYAALCAEGYERNPTAWACINLIACSVAEPDLRCVQTSTDEEDAVLPIEHPLPRLMLRPNKDQDQFEFLEQTLTYYLIAGEAYIHKMRARSGEIIGLRNLRPDRVSPVVNQYGEITRYEYTIDGRVIKPDLLADDVIFLKRLHPREDFRGLSQLSVAARQADLDNTASDFLRSVFANGGIPRAFLKLKRKLEPKEREDLKQRMRDKYGSATKGWNDWSVLDEDASIERFGLSPHDTELDAVFANTETRTCAVFGVPPILIGAKAGLDRATYANYREAKRSFWDETLAPLFERISAKLTHSVAAEFGEGLRIEWDFADVQALRDNANEAHARARDDYNAGLITLNEARAQLGHDPVEDGDRLKTTGDALMEDVIFQDLASKPKRRLESAIERAEKLLTEAERAA